jgi:hypothetical protein
MCHTMVLLMMILDLIVVAEGENIKLQVYTELFQGIKVFILAVSAIF